MDHGGNSISMGEELNTYENGSKDFSKGSGNGNRGGSTGLFLVAMQT
jgi:hypothetical protein